MYLEIQRLNSYNLFSPICPKIRAHKQGQDRANPISGSQVICIQSSDTISKLLRQILLKCDRLVTAAEIFPDLRIAEFRDHPKINQICEWLSYMLGIS